MKSLSGIGLVIILFFLPSVAFSYTGRIIFTGYLYQSPCMQSITSNSVTFSCQQGKNKTIRKISLSSGNGYLPMGLGTSKVKWINREHSLGVLEIAYR